MMMNASKMIAVLLPLMLGACNATFPKSEPVGRQMLAAAEAVTGL